MGWVDAVRTLVGLTGPGPAVALSSSLEDQVDKILHAREHPRTGAWRVPTVAEALSVPAINRAVTLICSTTGMLSMQGFRNGALMTDPPRLIQRPDPHESPYTFFSATAANFAKYGEFVWWIAKRDDDGLPSALVNVPLNELHVEDNPDSRLFPRYTWGTITGTRYTPANPAGQFVHQKYPLTEPFALRGSGPLQLAKAATSIAVESQTWAANFFGDGGKPRDVIKHAGTLDPTLRDEFGAPDPDTGLSEAERLKAQYTARDNNTPMVIDQMIESITHPEIDEAGAQMLLARVQQRADAALIFGLTGHWVEYVQSGASLTYQNTEMAFTELIKTCLQPLYLEPIEQAMSDLLTRSTVGRFNVKGFLRADIKTRFDVHGVAIDKGIYDAAYARQEEGIEAGDVEFMPVPFAPPAAVPASVPRFAALRDVKCDGCGRLLVRAAGPVEAACRHCKRTIAA